MEKILMEKENFKDFIKGLRNVIFGLYYRKLNGDEITYKVINKPIKNENESKEERQKPHKSAANDDEVILYDMTAKTYKRYKLNGIYRVVVDGKAYYCEKD